VRIWFFQTRVIISWPSALTLRYKRVLNNFWELDEINVNLINEALPTEVKPFREVFFSIGVKPLVSEGVWSPD
jgi:hypothetical protein